MANELIKYEIVVDTSSGEASLKRFAGDVQQTAQATSTGAGQMGTAFKSMGGAINGVGAALKAMAVEFAVFIAAAKTIQFFKDAAFAAGDFTKQMSGLGLVLQSIGAPVKQTQGEFLALAIAVEKATGSLRQEGIAALQRFIGLTQDATKAQVAYKLAVNISEGSGKSLAESVDLVANLLSGKAARSAGEFGVAIKNQNGEMKTASEILTTLQTRYGNATDTIKDGNADIDAATSAWNELKLALGDFIKETAPVAGFFAKQLQTLTVATAKAREWGTILLANAKAAKEIWALTKSDDTPEVVQAKIAEIQTTLNAATAEADAKFFSVWNAQFGEKLPKSLSVTKKEVDNLKGSLPTDTKVADAAKAAADEFDRMTGSTKALTEESRKLQAAYDLTIEKFNKSKLTLEQTEYILGQIVKRQVEISHQTGGLIGGFGPDTSKQDAQIDSLDNKIKELRVTLHETASVPILSDIQIAEAKEKLHILTTASENLIRSLSKAANSSAVSGALDKQASLLSEKPFQSTGEKLTSFFGSPSSGDAVKDREAEVTALRKAIEAQLKLNELKTAEFALVQDIASLQISAAEQELATQTQKFNNSTSDPSVIADIAQSEVDESLRIRTEALDLQRELEIAQAQAIGLDVTAVRQKYDLLQTLNERKASQDRLAIARAEKNAKEQLAFAYLGAIANLSDQIFKTNKATAIANAIVNTYEGVTKALGSAPPPYNFILAALVAAAGAIQIRNIANTHKNSASLNSSGASAAPPPSSPEPSTPSPSIRPLEVTLVLQGAGFINDMDAFGRDFIKTVNRSQLEGSSAPLAGV